MWLYIYFIQAKAIPRNQYSFMWGVMTSKQFLHHHKVYGTQTGKWSVYTCVRLDKIGKKNNWETDLKEGNEAIWPNIFVVHSLVKIAAALNINLHDCFIHIEITRSWSGWSNLIVYIPICLSHQCSAPQRLVQKFRMWSPGWLLYVLYPTERPDLNPDHSSLSHTKI